MKINQVLTTLVLLVCCSAKSANNFASLDEAVPLLPEVLGIAPVFDFDGDG